MHNAHIHHWLLIWLFVPLLCRSRTDIWVCVCACPKHVSTNVFRAIWCIYICICMYVHVCVCVCVCIFICVCVWCLSLSPLPSPSSQCACVLLCLFICWSLFGYWLYMCIYIYIQECAYLSIYLSISLLAYSPLIYSYVILHMLASFHAQNAGSPSFMFRTFLIIDPMNSQFWRPFAAFLPASSPGETTKDPQLDPFSRVTATVFG